VIAERSRNKPARSSRRRQQRAAKGFEKWREQWSWVGPGGPAQGCRPGGSSM